MDRFELFKTLRRHRQWAERRAITAGQNKVAKFTLIFLSSFVLIYLISAAVMLAMLANESHRFTSIELLMGVCPLILAIDFLMRFISQQTPAQIIKPYVLLPIPKYACINTFLATSLFTWGNLTWFALFLPYCLMSVVFSFGIAQTLALLLLLWILILANSQWYLIVRTLLTDTQLWWLLPIGIYALISAPFYIGADSGLETFCEFWAGAGTAIHDANPFPFLFAILLLTALLAVNRRLQYIHIWRELSRTEQTQLHSVSEFRFLERYGTIGEYLKLEIKSILRNKNPRKSFISATAFVSVFSMLITFTSVYDGAFMGTFWCTYNFLIYAAMMIIRIMCNEGNYIDALMVRRENILALLQAKYFFYCAMLLLPFCLMLPTVFSGKWSLLMLVSYGIFTAGFQYFLVFQMAVYNKVTTPLNTKFISRSGIENNYIQIIAQLAVFSIPLIMVSTLQTFLSETASYLIMFAIGIVFICTHRLWLRNIYVRLMARRYDNMASFRASR